MQAVTLSCIERTSEHHCIGFKFRPYSTYAGSSSLQPVRASVGIHYSIYSKRRTYDAMSEPDQSQDLTLTPRGSLGICIDVRAPSSFSTLQ